jgi:hypothetical protein
MSLGNKLIQKIFFCFKVDTNNEDTVNKIEVISDKVLDAAEKGAILLNNLAFSAIDHTGKVPHSVLDPMKLASEAGIHLARSKIDDNIGNEEFLAAHQQDVALAGNVSELPAQ